VRVGVLWASESRRPGFPWWENQGAMEPNDKIGKSRFDQGRT
jgi:hypothetical protein